MFAKIPAFIFSLLILVQSVGIGYDDIVRLDELYEHATYHQQQYGDSFFTFLAKHYGDQKEQHHRDHQEEQDDHQDLPFQQQQCQHQLNPIFLPQLVIHRAEPSNSFADRKSSRSFYYTLSDSDAHSRGVFQPPRLA